LATGVNLTNPAFGSVEFDGTNLFLTNNAGSPTRKTLAFTDSTIANGAVGSSQLASGLTLGGTTTGTFSGNVTGNVSGSAASFTGGLSGDVTGNQGTTVISATTVTGKALTGYSSASGTITATDTILSAINKLNGNNALKANLASPTFTGTVVLPTGTALAAPLKLATGVNLTNPAFGSVEFDGTNLLLTNNSVSPTRKTLAFTDAPTFTGVPVAPTASSGTNTGQIATTEFVQSAIQGVVGAAPAALDTLNELAEALNDDASYASTITNALSLKAPLASPTFTGTVNGITASMVGLGSVSNTSDANKPVSTAQQTALDLKAPLASPTFTGLPLAPTASSGTDTGQIANTQFVQSAIQGVLGTAQNALDLKAPLASPTFTGTVGGITKSMVGLGNVANTSDANKPVSTAQQDALDLKAPLATPTFTGVPVAPTASSGTNTGQIATTQFVQSAIQGVLSTAQTALDLKAPLASPTFTGTVNGITKSMVGLGNVANTSDANKPVSTAQQDALDLKAPLASPTFTGTVGGITKSMVGLGSVSNTSDANKPVSSAQQDALDLKANLASPTFTGTVRLPTGTALAAPLRLATGISLTNPVFGSVEFDGTNLFLTNNAGSPTRKTIAFTDAPTFTGVPVAPTATSGTNNGQIATTQFVQSAILGVVGAAPAALDTLNELAEALNDDASYASTITNALSLKAPLASPTFTGTVSGITASMVGLGSVNNTSDANKPVSTAQQTALDLKSNLVSPTFTGTVTSPAFSGPLTGNVTGNVTGSAGSFTGSLVGDVTGTQGATAISAATVTGKALTGYVSGAGTVSATDTILTAINKLNGNDGLKAPLASPTFTGTVVLPTGTSSVAPLRLATGVNLTTAVFGSVEFDGTNLYLTNNSGTPTRKTIAFTDSALATGAVGSSQLASGLTLGGTTTGTFSGPLTGNVTGNISGSAGSFTGSLVGDVTGTQSATAISAATVTGKALTGYVSGAGTVSATDTILTAINKLNGNDGLKANLASPTFTGTVTSPAFSGPLTGNVTGNVTGSAGSFTGSLVGDVTGTQGATAISAATITGKALTGYVSGAGTIAATDTILGAINKLNGNDALKANLASPTFTGTVSGITATMVGLGNVTNTADASKPVSTAQQAALDLKANLASPTFTGTVSGITASMVGLGNVGNTSDANKPVSTAQQTALNLKANLASPTFSGTVVLPTGTSSVAPLKFATGTSLTTAVFGSVEFDGTNLYLTNNSASPTRKTLAFTDSVIASVPLASLTAAPLKPIVAWGNNHDGQTTLPTLANVAAVAAGDSHSLVLLDGGTVVAWGLNTSGQTTIPGGLTGVTEIAAGTAHNLVRKSDGTLVAWGDNTYAQTTIPSGITTATKVAAGEKHSLALLANGTVRAWGDNGFGQTTLPSGLTGATITAIAAGYDHCLALKSDGTVISWGRDDAGQVTLPIGLSNVVAIAAGAYHSLALKSDGTVIAWGWDGGGQVTVPASLSGVTKIAGGYAFSMALKSDGTLVLWGDNTDSQTTVPSTATQVTHIAAGASHALALRADAIAAQVARLDQDNVFTGKVGIKRTPATNSLEVEGTASKTTAGGWLANSDRRIKTEIRSITGALEKLDQVHLVDFRYTDEYRAAHPSIEDVRYPNVIAQEFATVFPDDVKSSGEVMPDGSPILQVDTYPLTIYAAAAVQELHRENRELKKKIADQDRKFADQESRLRRLEEALGNK
jgi:hypothetical protein